MPPCCLWRRGSRPRRRFGKALGSGLAGLSLRDMAVMNNPLGKPEMVLTGSAKAALQRLGGRRGVHLPVARERGGAGDVRHRGRVTGPAAGDANVMLTLAYDGTDFAGWQVQSRERTVQGVLEAALARMLDRPVRVRAAGAHRLGRARDRPGGQLQRSDDDSHRALGGGDQLLPAARRTGAGGASGCGSVRRPPQCAGARLSLPVARRWRRAPPPAPLLLPRAQPARPCAD